MKKKYRITNKVTGKEYIYRGSSCEEAMRKFKNRKVFGEFITFSTRLLQCDADTRGEKWAQYLTDKSEEIMIEVVGA